jgi:hypothetical protein
MAQARCTLAGGNIYESELPIGAGKRTSFRGSCLDFEPMLVDRHSSVSVVS